MQSFATLLDRLSFEPSRNGKLRLIETYLATEPDPERGYGLAAMTGSLKFRYATPSLVRVLLRDRVDPLLFNLSYQFVGDLSETVAMLWPEPAERGDPPALSTVVETLAATTRAAFPGQLAIWLDGLDTTGRWALLKLITGSMRIGVSSRLAKTALAALGKRDVNEIEDVWHGLEMVYRGGCISTLDEIAVPSDTMPVSGSSLTSSIERRSWSDDAFRGSGRLGEGDVGVRGGRYRQGAVRTQGADRAG